MLADGLIAQARARPAEEDGSEDDKQQRQIDHRALVKKEASDDGNVLKAGNGNRGHGNDLLEVGARAKIHAVDKRRERGREDVDGHAVDRVVRAEGDGRKRVDHIDRDTGKRAAQKAQPVRARDVAHEEADERADGSQALEADVHHAGSLTIKLCQRDEKNRDCQTDGRQKQARNPIHYAAPSFLLPKTRFFHASNSGSFVSAIPATEKTITSA